LKTLPGTRWRCEHPCHWAINPRGAGIRNAGCGPRVCWRRFTGSLEKSGAPAKLGEMVRQTKTEGGGFACRNAA